MPGKVGMVSRLFCGFAFGIAGVAAGVLGLLAAFLPRIQRAPAASP